MRITTNHGSTRPAVVYHILRALNPNKPRPHPADGARSLSLHLFVPSRQMGVGARSPLVRGRTMCVQWTQYGHLDRFSQQHIRKEEKYRTDIDQVKNKGKTLLKTSLKADAGHRAVNMCWWYYDINTLYICIIHWTCAGGIWMVRIHRAPWWESALYFNIAGTMWRISFQLRSTQLLTKWRNRRGYLWNA